MSELPTSLRRLIRATQSRFVSRDRVRAMLAAGVVLGIGAVGTTAAWTDQSTATTGNFSTGKIDLKVAGGSETPVDDNPTAFTTNFTAKDMAPGSSTTANLVVWNKGTVKFGYTISGASVSGSDAGLAAALNVSIYAGSNCSGTDLNGAASFSGTSVSSRQLTANNSETLCFKVKLPDDAATTLQGKSASGKFTVTATSIN